MAPPQVETRQTGREREIPGGEVEHLGTTVSQEERGVVGACSLALRRAAAACSKALSPHRVTAVPLLAGAHRVGDAAQRALRVSSGRRRRRRGRRLRCSTVHRLKALVGTQLKPACLVCQWEGSWGSLPL